MLVRLLYPRFKSRYQRPVSSPLGPHAFISPVIASASRTTAQWIALLEGIAVPCGPINDVGEAFWDEQVQAKNLVVNQPLAHVWHA